jgi:hypothetical protein
MHIGLGAQTMRWEEQGVYTGEISSAVPIRHPGSPEAPLFLQMVCNTIVTRL